MTISQESNIRFSYLSRSAQSKFDDDFIVIFQFRKATFQLLNCVCDLSVVCACVQVYVWSQVHVCPCGGARLLSGVFIVSHFTFNLANDLFLLYIFYRGHICMPHRWRPHLLFRGTYAMTYVWRWPLLLGRACMLCR